MSILIIPVSAVILYENVLCPLKYVYHLIQILFGNTLRIYLLHYGQRKVDPCLTVGLTTRLLFKCLTKLLLGALVISLTVIYITKIIMVYMWLSKAKHGVHCAVHILSLFVFTYKMLIAQIIHQKHRHTQQADSSGHCSNDLYYS